MGPPECLLRTVKIFSLITFNLCSDHLQILNTLRIIFRFSMFPTPRTQKHLLVGSIFTPLSSICCDPYIYTNLANHKLTSEWTLDVNPVRYSIHGYYYDPGYFHSSKCPLFFVISFLACTSNNH